MSTQSDPGKLLSLILKAIEEYGSKEITTDVLLEKVSEISPDLGYAFHSHFNAGLGDGKRYGLLMVRNGRVKPLYNLTSSHEPRSFSSKLLMVSEDLKARPGSSRRTASSSSDYEDEAAATVPGSSTRWMRPRDADITYNELRLIRQVFSPSELAPEWHETRPRRAAGNDTRGRSLSRGRRRSTTRRGYGSRSRTRR
ncbi:uncharacterized protein LOC134211797 [Armigeres subalbatus]|uniref:uncharacterized protein LOC134211797 n=1 Tax=Armigeres subalbatus TaxID=124917 RepID=UPI002ED37950